MFRDKANLIVCCLMVGLTGCATTGASITSTRSGVEAYSGPKAKLAVSDFEDQTAKKEFTSANFGAGLKTIVKTAFQSTNRFLVMDGQMAHGGSPDLLVRVAITDYDVSTQQGRLSDLFIFKKGDSSGKVGGDGSTRTVRLGLDLQVVDSKTRALVAATTASAEATGISGTVEGEGSHKNLGTPKGQFGGQQEPAVVEAMRKAIQMGAADIAKQIPATFYRHGSGGTTASTPPTTEGPRIVSLDGCRNGAVEKALQKKVAKNGTKKKGSPPKG
jgi:curli biogenesis system outer membrane secretion channel CsgG